MPGSPSNIFHAVILAVLSSHVSVRCDLNISRMDQRLSLFNISSIIMLYACRGHVHIMPGCLK